MEKKYFASILVLATFVLGPAAEAQLGGLGKKIKDVKDVAEAFSIDDAKEIEMGTAAHPYLSERMGGLSKDSKLNSYVTQVGKRLAKNAKREAIDYKFFVINSPEVNAFAMPGGFVYVTTGILAMLEDESELAAVMGHEIAHVEERHGVEGMRKAVLAEKGADYGAQAAGGKIPSEVAHIVANLFANMALSGHGRGQELESDKVGIGLSNAAGYDPMGAVRTFNRLLELEGAGAKAKGLEKFFASHPPTDKRIKQAETQIAGLGSKGTETRKAEYGAVTKTLRAK
jgi:beta-barrel assembly-enhancing protease